MKTDIPFKLSVIQHDLLLINDFFVQMSDNIHNHLNQIFD